MLSIWARHPRRSLAVVLVSISCAASLSAQDVALPAEAPSAHPTVALGDSTSAEFHLAQTTSLSAELRRMYSARAWALLWSENGAPTASANALVDALNRIGERGLAPRNFDVARLRSLVGAGLADAEARADFDATLSTAGLRVLRVLRTGQTLAPDVRARQPAVQSETQIVDELLSMTTTSSAAAVLDAAEPQYAQYRLLKGALATYRARADGDSSLRSRVAQIEMSLERWRWLPHQSEGSAIIVNVPAFQMQVVSASDDGDSEALAMDVVVGDAGKHRTPIFSDTMEYLIFAPYWNVPMSLVRSELLPIAARDPYLLTVNNYQIVNARGQVMPATAAAVKLVSTGKAWIRQLPGGTNALGKVKFMFPNEFDIYLHDTPATPDFQLVRRDRSHGCIRVADPAALARLLLRDQPGWDADAIGKAMNGSAPVRVNLTKGVPVHIIYATAMAHADGTMSFYEDIYGLDADLAAALAHDVSVNP